MSHELPSDPRVKIRSSCFTWMEGVTYPVAFFGVGHGLSYRIDWVVLHCLTSQSDFDEGKSTT